MIGQEIKEEEPNVQGLNWKEVLIFGTVYGIGLWISVAEYDMKIFLVLRGVFLVIFTVFFFPIAIHIKCVYFSDQVEESNSVCEAER